MSIKLFHKEFAPFICADSSLLLFICMFNNYLTSIKKDCNSMMINLFTKNVLNVKIRKKKYIYSEIVDAEMTIILYTCSGIPKKE